MGVCPKVPDTTFTGQGLQYGAPAQQSFFSKHHIIGCPRRRFDLVLLWALVRFVLPGYLHPYDISTYQVASISARSQVTH